MGLLMLSVEYLRLGSGDEADLDECLMLADNRLLGC